MRETKERSIFTVLSSAIHMRGQISIFGVGPKLVPTPKIEI